MLKKLLSYALCALPLVGAATVHAAGYPERPIRMVIPFPPGGTLDALGRDVAKQISDQTGQNVVVENRAGGNGTIGADVVARSKADGYTLLFSASTFVTAPMTMTSVPFKVEKDFLPVAMAAKAPLSVSVRKELPVKNLAELLKYARANPGKLTFAVGSIGSAGHLSTALLKRQGGMDYMVVPYKGTAPAFQDLIGGRIDGFIDPVLGAMEYYRSGMLRILAVTSDKRLGSLPDVPTVSETLPGYQYYSWYGLWAPAGTPPEIVQKLNTEVNKALGGDIQAKYTRLGLLITPGSVEDFARFQREDMAAAKRLIDEEGIRVE